MSEPIDIRSLVRGPTVSGKAFHAEIIGENQDHVWFVLRNRIISRSETQQRRKQEESDEGDGTFHGYEIGTMKGRRPRNVIF